MPPVGSSADRFDPPFGKPGVPVSGEGRGSASPLRFPMEGRRGERQAPAFTAGERLAVASEITGGDEARRDGGTGRPRFAALWRTLFAIVVVLAGIGAVTVYRAIDGVFHG